MKRIAVCAIGILFGCGGAGPAHTLAETCMGAPGPCPPPDAGTSGAVTPDAGPPVLFTLLYDWQSSHGGCDANGTAYAAALSHCTQAKSLTAADLPKLVTAFSDCAFSGGPAAYTIDCSRKCGPYTNGGYCTGYPTYIYATWTDYHCASWATASTYSCAWY